MQGGRGVSLAVGALGTDVTKRCGLLRRLRVISVGCAALPAFPLCPETPHPDDRRSSSVWARTGHTSGLLIPNKSRAAEPIVPGQALDRMVVGLKSNSGPFTLWCTCNRDTGASHGISIPLISKPKLEKRINGPSKRDNPSMRNHRWLSFGSTCSKPNPSCL